LSSQVPTNEASELTLGAVVGADGGMVEVVLDVVDEVVVAGGAVVEVVVVAGGAVVEVVEVDVVAGGAVVEVVVDAEVVVVA